jgi:hypothetical protein
MNNKKTIIVTVSVILMGAVARLLPHPANVTPLTAIALLGGSYLSPALALTVPLAALFASDLFLGFHGTMPFVYASFILVSALGLFLKKRRNAQMVAAACLGSSFLFFILTNFGVWMTSGLYAHNASGLINCYTAALPFLRNSALGDLFFTAALFSIETAALKLIPAAA